MPRHRGVRLHPLVDYLKPAWDLVVGASASPHIFISTDDEAVIAEIENDKHARDYDFTYYYFE